MNIFDHLDGPHPPCMVCYNGFGGCSGCAVSNLTAHFCNIDGIKYLKFEPSTTSNCEHFALSFVRNHQKIRSQCNIYELPFEASETCFLHCSHDGGTHRVANLWSKNVSGLARLLGSTWAKVISRSCLGTWPHDDESWWHLPNTCWLALSWRSRLFWGENVVVVKVGRWKATGCWCDRLWSMNQFIWDFPTKWALDNVQVCDEATYMQNPRNLTKFYWT
jgi:hypothetical protein